MNNESISPQLSAEFMKSILYFSHPSEMLTDKILKVYQKDDELFLKRIKNWHDSFRSIYNCLKNGDIPYFYYLIDSYSVLFISSGVCKLDKICAILGNSPSLLKEEFKKSNVQFEEFFISNFLH
jgi:hypothetical protein